MIKFQTLCLRNFLSYGNNTTVLNLDRPGTTLIIGENLDSTSNGQGANGVGKSTIFNALTYAVYDKPISKISKDNLVNNINGKGMEVSIDFTNGDGHQYKVKRERKAKAGAAGNNVYLYIDGVDKSVDSAGTNALIESIIGIPYDLFIRVVVFSATNIPFLDLPVTHTTAPNQKDIIEELFGMTILSAKADSLKQHIKDNESSLAMKKAKVELQESEHTRHQSLIDNATKRVANWERQNEESIVALQAKLKRVEAVDFDAERTLHNEVDVISVKVATVNDVLKHEKRTLKELMATYAKGEQELTHLRDSKCPYCEQDFADATQKIAHLATETEQLFAAIDTLQPKITTLSNEYELLQQQLDIASDKITINDLDQLLAIKNQSESIRSKCEELAHATNPFEEPLQELIDTKLNTIDYTDVNEAVRVIEHQKFLLKILTKKDSFVRKELMNKNLPLLNASLREDLIELGLPHVVEFTHEMTAKISQFGRELEFGNLSAGQSARVNLALAYAFKAVRERRSNSVNICMLDEALDHGLDAVGVEAAARLIKMKAGKNGQSTYVISHRSEVESVFSKTLTVQLSNGFSYIKDNSVEE